MKKDELKSLIRSCNNKNKTLPLSDLEKLKLVANVTLEIDRDTNDYFYKISLDDLVDKTFDNKLIIDNKWELSLNEEEIYLYL